MEHKTYRRGSALAGAAVFGLAATALMAPSAYADTDADLNQETLGTATVQVEPGPAAGPVAGDEAVVPETAGEAVEETSGEESAGEESAVEETAVEVTDETAVEVTDETAAEGATGEEATGEETLAEEALAEETFGEEGTPEDGAIQCVEAVVTPASGNSADPADTTTFVNGGSEADGALAGADLPAIDPAAGEAVLPTTAPADSEGQATEPTVPAEEGAPTQPDCVVAPPAEGHDDDQTELPVGGVDAGMGEVAGQNTALPIAAAAAAAAALGLGAFRMVRRSRSNA